MDQKAQLTAAISLIAEKAQKIKLKVDNHQSKNLTETEGQCLLDQLESIDTELLTATKQIFHLCTDAVDRKIQFSTIATIMDEAYDIKMELYLLNPVCIKESTYQKSQNAPFIPEVSTAIPQNPIELTDELQFKSQNEINAYKNNNHNQKNISQNTADTCYNKKSKNNKTTNSSLSSTTSNAVIHNKTTPNQKQTKLILTITSTFSNAEKVGNILPTTKNKKVETKELKNQLVSTSEKDRGKTLSIIYTFPIKQSFLILN